MIAIHEIARRIPGAVVQGNQDVTVTGITLDSRHVEPGWMFAAVPGQKVDGAAFIDAAVAAGASAVLAEAFHPCAVPLVVVDSVREALGPVAAACYGDPGRELHMVGVTGTNGKTTITYLVEAALASGGIPCGVMGTIEYRFGDHRWSASHTTPEATVIQSTLRQMVKAGAAAVAMEVSSHGLSLGRVRGCPFHVVAFTNLTQDHLDFHQSMEAYGEAKMRLFTDAIADEADARVVVNLDDPFSSQILARANHAAWTISCDWQSTADFRPAAEPVFDIHGIDAAIRTPEGEVRLRSALTGRHNLNNLLVALAVARASRVSFDDILRAFARQSKVPGRLERVDNPEGCAVFVDYAHTPDALDRVLFALRPLTRGRLLCVFGCGGDRDKNKRPLMGRAVAQGAHVAVVTSDNPRTEDPDRIIEMVVQGVQEGGMIPADSDTPASGQYVAIPDRAAAIRFAIAAAGPDDTVLIAGKGHEDYIIVGTKRSHFDDREQAAAAIAACRQG